MIDHAFGHWLAGLVDGEGSFVIADDRRCNGFRCSFQLGLRDDDAPILQEIAERTGLGTVRFHRGMATWVVNRKAEAVELVEIFDAYPLRAKKARDFRTWREAVVEWNAAQKGPGGARGETSHLAKFPDAVIETIRERSGTGETQKELAGEFGIDQSHISRIVNGKVRRPPQAPDVRWNRMRQLKDQLEAERKRVRA